MELDLIKNKTTWNDASASINSNFAKLLQAIASLGPSSGEGFNEHQLREFLTQNGYTTADWVLAQEYLTRLSAESFFPTKEYSEGNYLKIKDAESLYAPLVGFNTLSGNFDSLKNRFDALDNALNDDVSGKINTWNEIVDFLDEYNGSEDLATILSGMNADIALRLKTADFDAWKTGVYSPLATRVSIAEGDISTHTTQISGLTTRVGNAETNISTNAKGIADNKTAIATNTSNISANATAITNLGKRVTTNERNIAEIFKWFAVDSDGNLYTTYNLYSTKEISANGLSVGSGGSGGGLISQVFGTTAFGTIASESNSATFNAYAIDSLYKRIVSLEGKATAVSFVPSLTSGKQIGTISIDGVSTVLYGVDAYSKTEADGTFLKLSGGTIEGTLMNPLTIKTSAKEVGIPMCVNGVVKMWVGWQSDNGTYLYSSAQNAYLGIKDNGTPHFNGNTLLHSGNIGSFKAGGLESEYLVSLDNAGYNKVFSSGFQATNRPSENYATGLTLYNTELGYTYQLAYSTTGGIFSRYKNGTTWSAWNTLLHSNNYSQYALPLSGGKVSGEVKINGKNTLAAPLIIETPSMGYSGYIQFTDGSTELGWLGFSNKVAVIRQGGANSTIIHSGNYNSYSPKLDGTGASGTWGISISGNAKTLKTSAYPVINANEVSYTDCAVRFLSAIANTSTNLPTSTGYQNGMLVLPLHDSGSTAQMYFSKGDEHFYYRSLHTSAWKKVAFTDSNITGNAATADKATLADTASTLKIYTVVPMTKETAGKWRQFAKLQVSSRYIGKSASFQLSVSSSSGKNGAVCDVYAMMYQQDALGNAPIYTIQTNCDDRKLKIAAVLNYDSSGSTITLYAYCPTIYTGVSMVVPSQNVDVVSIGTELLSELPSGTVITPDKTGTSFAATKLITASGNNYAYHSDASKYTVFGVSGYNCYVDGATTYFRYGANSTIGVTLNSSGNTTIGSTGDLAGTTYKLYVNGSTKIAGTIYDVNNIYPNSAAERYIGTSTNPFKYMYAEWYGAGTGQALSFGANNAVHMTVNTSGNIGIGTTSPEHKLHISGGNAVVTKSDNTSTWLKVQNTNGAVSLLSHTNRGVYDSTKDRWLIVTDGNNSWLPAGNVGIGASANEYHKLYVHGNIYADGNIALSSRLLAKSGVFCGYESTCGAYMEAGADGTYAGIYTCNNGAWQSSNIYLHNNGNVTINKHLVVNSSTNLKSTLSVVGTITANSGVKVASGQALTFLDASGKEHKLTYDSTAGAFKFDGNILVTGDGQFNAIN